MASTPTPAKDRITCHILDTTAGKPARGVRVRLELTPPSATSFAPAVGSTTAGSAAAAAASPSAAASAAVSHHGHHGGAGPVSKTFESQTDDDGRVKAWLPFSASNASGEVPVYTLDDVLGELEAGGSRLPSRWTLRFDTAGYFAAADEAGSGGSGSVSGSGSGGTFFPEVLVVFEVLPGQHYHVPLLLSPYGYTTYRGS